MSDRRWVRLLRGAGVAATVALAAGACQDQAPPPEQMVPLGVAERGIPAMRRHGCGGCHVIPGVREAKGLVGPSLRGLAHRPYLAGRLPNNAANLTAWIRDPQALAPGTLMPRLGVTDTEARDISAYLYRASGPRAAIRPGSTRP